MSASALRFSDFLSGSKPEQEELQQEAVESVTDDAPETAPEPEAASDDEPAAEAEPEAEPEEQAAPSTAARVTFEDRLRARGIDLPQDVDPEDLYDSSIERIMAGTQALAEAERLRAELESIRNQPPPAQQVPAAPPQNNQPETEPEPEAPARMFRELKEYDPTLLQYVTRNESGIAVAKPEWGEAGVNAARTINAYDQDEQRQAQMLLRNPNLLIQEHMGELERLAEKKASAIIEQRFAAMLEEQQKAAREQQEQSQAASQEQALTQWHEQNKAKLFKIGPDGNPLTMPLSNSPSKTPMGRYFMDRLQELRSELPNANEITLRNLAIREAELAVPEQQAAPAPAEKPAAPLTQAEQKKQFVQQRQPQVPNQNVPMATASEAVANQPLRFADMVRSNPTNHDTIAGWK